MAKSFLKMTKCDVNRNLDSKNYKLKLNPSSISLDKEIVYNHDSSPGTTGYDPKFNKFTPENLSFEFIIDATGVIAGISGVNDEFAKIEAVIYDYVGDKHEPGHVQVIWGDLLYYGRLKDIKVNYLMFSPEGNPLRAKLKIGFVSSISAELQKKEDNSSSPDLSHIVEVKAGDTLPLLCERIYQDSSYYAAVARFNNLAEFRNLKPGLKLRFPPLG